MVLRQVPNDVTGAGGVILIVGPLGFSVVVGSDWNM
jgi:hypothetical protein